MFAAAKQAFYLVLLLTLTACHDAQPPLEATQKPQKNTQAPKPSPRVTEEKASVLVYLDPQSQPAQFVLPKCTAKTCPKLQIDTLYTQDQWFNDWLGARQADVLMQQIEQDQQQFSLQQAVNRYAEASQAWQQQYRYYQPFELQLSTALVYQKNGIVLVQMQVNSHQAETKVKDRLYFFVANHHTQQSLTLKQVVAEESAKTLEKIVNQAYKKWLATQTDEVKTAAPKQLQWQQSEWFYDSQGIGLHFRAGQISPTAEQLDIYLSAAQTKQVLKTELYFTLFNPKST